MLELLQKIHGIGPILAGKLVNRIPSFTSLYALQEYLLNNEIYDELPKDTQYDVLYKPVGVGRFVIEEFEEALKPLRKKFTFEICGSYRRHKPASKDIDMVFLGNLNKWNKFRKMVNQLNGYKLLKPYSIGEKKVHTLLRVEHEGEDYYIRCDIFLTHEESWAYTILYATGSGTFNVVMRRRAKSMGYKLNQYGLYTSDDEFIPTKTEEEIFEHLDMEYHSPEERSM